MEVLRPYGYWTLWMSKQHTVTLYHVRNATNVMFNHLDGILWALGQQKKCKEELYFAVKFACQKLSKWYIDVSPMMGIHLISANILDSFQMFWLCRKWDEGMHSDPEDETSYTTQFQKAFLKYAVNEYCAKHQHLPIIKPESVPNNNLFSSTMASRSGQSSYDTYDLTSKDEEYLMPQNVAKTMPSQSDCAVSLLTAARLNSNSPPEMPQNWGQINPNFHDHHSDPREISSTFSIPDITGWWCQQEETYSKYANLSNLPGDIFHIIPHGVGDEACFSLEWDIIRWRQSKTTRETCCETVIVWQIAGANYGILVGDDLALHTTHTENDLEMNREAVDRKLHWMAKVDDFLEMWQGSENLHAA